MYPMGVQRRLWVRALIIAFYTWSPEYSLENVLQMFDDLNTESNRINFMMISPDIASHYSKELKKRTLIRRSEEKIQYLSKPKVFFYVMIRHLTMEKGFLMPPSLAKTDWCKKNHIFRALFPDFRKFLSDESPVSHYW